MTQFEIYSGIDWSTRTHQVAVVDADGEILGERAFAHGRRPGRRQNPPDRQAESADQALLSRLPRGCPGPRARLGPRSLEPRPDPGESPPRALDHRQSHARKKPRPNRPRRKRPRRPSQQTRPDRAGNRRGRRRLRQADREQAQSAQRRNQRDPNSNQRGPRPDQDNGRRASRRHPALRSRHRTFRPGRRHLRSLRQRPTGRPARPGMLFRTRARHETIRTNHPGPKAPRRERAAQKRRLPLGHGRHPARQHQPGELPRAQKPRT